jgi:ParB family chromosome partitioning protein
VSEVVTRDDLVELSCGHLATVDPDRPTAAIYCQSCGLHLLPIGVDQDAVELVRASLEKTHERLSDREPTEEVLEIIGKIRDAIQRLEAGTYGSCAKCFGEIEPKRLEFFPYADLCFSCEFKTTRLPAPAKQGAPKSAPVGSPADSLAEVPPSVPAPMEGDGEASVSPDPALKTSSGARPGERTYADLALPNIHERGQSMLESIPVKSIKPSPDNPRDDVGDVSELAATIAAVGLLNPVTVKQNGSGVFYLTTGHRRLAAVKSLGWDVIPAQVENTRSDREVDEARLIENIQREDLTPLEEAKAFKRLIDRHGVSQRELADRVGRSQAHVSKRLALLDLPKPAVELVAKGPDSGGISLEDAQKLSKVKSSKAVERIVKNFTPGAYGRTIDSLVEDEVRKEKNAEKKKKLKAKLKDENVKVVTQDEFYKSARDRRAQIGKGFDQLTVDVEKHKSESCHVAYLFETYNGVQVIHACIDTRRHGPKGKSKLKGKRAGHAQQTISPERAEQDRRRGQLEKASNKRIEFVLANLGKKKWKGSAEDVFGLFVLAIAADAEQAGIYELDANSICDFLGIKPERGKDEEYGVPERRSLREMIARKPADGVHIVTAAAVDAIESSLRYTYASVDYRAYKPYFDWLERQGYELSEFEAGELAEKTDEEISTR